MSHRQSKKTPSKGQNPDEDAPIPGPSGQEGSAGQGQSQDAPIPGPSGQEGSTGQGQSEEGQAQVPRRSRRLQERRSSTHPDPLNIFARMEVMDNDSEGEEFPYAHMLPLVEFDPNDESTWYTQEDGEYEEGVCEICQERGLGNREQVLYGHQRQAHYGQVAESGTHKGKVRFRCWDCPKDFADRKVLARHCRSKHRGWNNIFSCNHCGETSTDRTIMYKHCRRHCRRDFCSRCNKEFYNLEKLRIHEETCTAPPIPIERRPIRAPSPSKVAAHQRLRLERHLAAFSGGSPGAVPQAAVPQGAVPRGHQRPPPTASASGTQEPASTRPDREPEAASPSAEPQVGRRSTRATPPQKYKEVDTEDELFASSGSEYRPEHDDPNTARFLESNVAGSASDSEEEHPGEGQDQPRQEEPLQGQLGQEQPGDEQPGQEQPGQDHPGQEEHLQGQPGQEGHLQGQPGQGHEPASVSAPPLRRVKGQKLAEYKDLVQQYQSVISGTASRSVSNSTQISTAASTVGQISPEGSPPKVPRLESPTASGTENAQNNEDSNQVVEDPPQPLLSRSAEFQQLTNMIAALCRETYSLRTELNDLKAQRNDANVSEAPGLDNNELNEGPSEEERRGDADLLLAGQQVHVHDAEMAFATPSLSPPRAAREDPTPTSPFLVSRSIRVDTQQASFADATSGTEVRPTTTVEEGHSLAASIVHTAQDLLKEPLESQLREQPGLVPGKYVLSLQFGVKIGSPDQTDDEQ